MNNYLVMRFNIDPTKVVTDAETVVVGYGNNYMDAHVFLSEYTYDLGKNYGVRIQNTAVKFCPACYGVEDGMYKISWNDNGADVFSAEVIEYYEDLNKNFGIAVIHWS